MERDRDSMLARLDRLEAENVALRREVQRMRVGEWDGDRGPCGCRHNHPHRRHQPARSHAGSCCAGLVRARSRQAWWPPRQRRWAVPRRSAPAAATPCSSAGRMTRPISTTYLENKVNDEFVFVALSDGAGTALSGTSHSGTGVTGYGSRGGYFRWDQGGHQPVAIAPRWPPAPRASSATSCSTSPSGSGSARAAPTGSSWAELGAVCSGSTASRRPTPL